MRKRITFVIGTVFALVVLAAGLLAYIYLKDTGVPLGGMARLDYNWDYVLAKNLRYEYKYDGDKFSFSYLAINEKDPIEVYGKDSGEYISTPLLDVFWRSKGPSGINSELLGYLSSGGKEKWTPSPDFAKWLFARADKYYIDKIETRYLKGGIPAAIITVKAKNYGLHGNFRYLLAEHKGIVVITESIAGAAVSNEEYKQFVFDGLFPDSVYRQVYPDGERDRQS